MRNDEVLVKVEGVSKKFCKSLKRSLWYGAGDISRSVLGLKNPEKLRKDEFWAVKDVSFEVRRGECLGLIGHNGAGKSTLLKMLNGLIRPDEGRIEMKGKVGALIELGAGFNPVLTGRENVYNNGAVLGFSKAEIDRKFDEIVAFAEMEEFIDTPVQNYSSGMKVRLGFAVASQMEPDVLIIDEVLAVGDLGFKIKCFNEIYRLIENAAVILVSHSMPQVAQVCRTGLVLKQGKINFGPGKVSNAIINYFGIFENNGLNIEGNRRGEIRNFKFGNNDTSVELDISKNQNQPEIILENCQNVFFETSVIIEPSVENFSLIISITDIDQKVVAQVTPPERMFTNLTKMMVVEAKVNSLMLNTGNYSISVHIYNKSNAVDRGEILIGIRNILKFTVKKQKFVGAAPILYESRWKEC
ncbi:ABC transporter ATP-binding protein [Algoriphagus hitonicola]|uniref:Lipopolysaccharide transport system ATP-binding protein n=1 Tax=Algoriphagus hitonicola TaxID=435880 RepID=A0A1I2TFX6_9BACT|nr:ABC transporter ATP-binding protein [Algoriphagus hitonicola]SFG63818.1 lipopolysaccharide transport system ATP-binding protein [Algoriphagus hitonicola]